MITASALMMAIMGIALVMRGRVEDRRLGAKDSAGSSYVYILDRALSNDQKENDIKAMIQAIKEANLKSRVQFTFFATGERANDQELVVIGQYRDDLARNSWIVEPKRKALEKALQEIESNYGQLAQAKESSIFIAIKRALEYVRSADTGNYANQYVIIRSDLKATGDPAIRSALIDVQGSRFTIRHLDNSGIIVRFCTQSVFEGKNTEPDDRLKALWLSFFTNPENVSFETNCPSLPIAPQVHSDGKWN